MSGTTEHRKLAAIMFTDMVGYSALAQGNDQLALELLEEHRRLLRSLFPRFNGAEIKTIGDAFLVEFSSALEAAQCAIEIQRALSKRNHDVTPARRIELKIGIHIGDVVHRDGDVYGDGVNIASRIEPLAGAGGICVSMDVERQIRNALEARFERLGAAELKNIKLPMELFRIVLPWEVAARASGLGPRASKQRLALALAGVALCLVVALGWWAFHSGAGRRDLPPAVPTSPTAAPASARPTVAAPASDKSIAVLAFANLSEEKENESFADGVSEELLNILSKVPGLKVSARTSAFSFKGKNVAVPEIAAQLGVAYVLEGSVRKSGNHVRITAQLVKAADGFHLWSENFDRELKDIFAVQDQIAALIARNLQLKLGPASATGSGTTNVEALRLYLEGRDQWNLRTSQGFDRAEDLFRRAVALDPRFARPHVGLADVRSVRADFAGTVNFQNRGGAGKTNMFAEVNEALRLDPALPEGHATLGMMLVHDWRIQEGVKTLRRAVELNPNYASGRQWLALGLACDGWMDEALAQMERAVELDPLSHRIHDNLALALLIAGRPAEALPQAEKALELMPDSTQAAVARVGSLTALGRVRETLPAARRLLEATLNHTGPGYERILFRALLAGGAAAEAEGYLTRVDPANSVQRFNLLLALGREQEALHLLDAAWLTRSDIGYILFAPEFDSIRGDQRFLKVLETTGLTEAHARAQSWRKAHPPQTAAPANSR